jgi:DNA-binding GntR family transcriptional regulator
MQAIKPKKSLVEQTYEILLDAICDGEIAQGERLHQDEIAARLQVSRQPVNSAISILRANNFVEDSGRRGVVVSAIDPNMCRSIYEYRSVVEPFAVRLAARRLPRDARAEADPILSAGRRAIAEGQLRELVRADVLFHEMIYRWSGNHVIEHSMRLNWHHTRRFMGELLRDPSSAAISWLDHQTIIDNLLAGDAETAERTMADHIRRAHEKITPVLARATTPHSLSPA